MAKTNAGPQADCDWSCSATRPLRALLSRVYPLGSSSLARELNPNQQRQLGPPRGTLPCVSESRGRAGPAVVVGGATREAKHAPARQPALSYRTPRARGGVAAVWRRGPVWSVRRPRKCLRHYLGHPLVQRHTGAG